MRHTALIHGENCWLLSFVIGQGSIRTIYTPTRIITRIPSKAFHRERRNPKPLVYTNTAAAALYIYTINTTVRSANSFLALISTTTSVHSSSSINQ